MAASGNDSDGTTVDSDWDTSEVCDTPQHAILSNHRLCNRNGKCITCGWARRYHPNPDAPGTTSLAGTTSSDAMSKALAKDAASLSVASRFRVPGMQCSTSDVRAPVEWNRAVRFAGQLHDGWIATSAISSGALPDRTEACREALLSPWKWGAHVASMLEALAHAVQSVLHTRSAAEPTATLEEIEIPRSAFLEGSEGSYSGFATQELVRILVSTARGLRMGGVRDKAMFARRASNALGDFVTAHADLRSAHWFVVLRAKSVRLVISMITEMLLENPVDPRCAPRLRSTFVAPQGPGAGAPRAASGTATAAAAPAAGVGGASSTAAAPAARGRGTTAAVRARSSAPIPHPPPPIHRQAAQPPHAGIFARGQLRSVQLDIDYWVEECFYTGLGEAARADGLRQTTVHLEAAWARIEAAEATTLAAMKRVGAASAPTRREADAEQPQGRGRRQRQGGGRGGRGGGRGAREDHDGGAAGGGGGGRGAATAAGRGAKVLVRTLPAAERDALRTALAAKDVGTISKAEAIRADLCFRCKHPRHGTTTPPCGPRGAILPQGPVFE